MFDRLRVLFAEQATADEVIVFLLLMSVFALVLAFALYALVLAVLWRGRLRKVTTFRSLLFPDRKQLGRYLGEYVLAGSTSLLVTLTVAARHDVVEYVLDYPLYAVETERIREVFPFGEVRADHMVDPGASMDELASALEAIADRPAGDGDPQGLPSIGLESLLLPTVRAGGVDEASLWLRAIVNEMDPGALTRFPTQRHLLVFAIALLIAYVGWFARSRSRAVEASGKAGSPDHGRVLGRLLVPAVCVAILLASAASAADPQRIARRATAVAGLGLDLEEDEARAADYFTRAMAYQAARGRLIRHLVDGGDSVPGMLGAIERLDTTLAGVRGTTEELARGETEARRDLDALRGELALLDMRLSRDSALSQALVGQLEQRTVRVEEGVATSQEQSTAAMEQSREALRRTVATADSIALLGRRIAASEAATERLLADLRRLAAQLQGNGLLLVVTSPGVPYQVHAGGPQGSLRAEGAIVGLHALPPGDYAVTSNLGTGRATVSVGGAETVRIARTINLDTSVDPRVLVPEPGPGVQ